LSGTLSQMRLILLAFLLPITAICLSAETKLVLKRAGTASSFESPQITVPAGERIIFSTPIVSGDVWLKDGKPIPGGLGPLFIIESARPRDSGRYRVTFISDGISESQEVLLTVVGMDGLSEGPHMETFTTRGTAGPGSASLVVGFVISAKVGEPSATKRVLVRAVGPTLADFGVTGFLKAPLLAVYNSAGQPCPSTPRNSSEVAEAHMKTGAFPLKANGGDAVMILTLTPGAYTAQVSSNQGTGFVVVDVHEFPPER
jgi:hypothetical protein